MNTDAAIANQVERALTEHYLRSDGPCGAGPLRFIDASEQELQSALSNDAETDSIRLLARACGGAALTAEVLANGWNVRPLDEHSPGFFRFLMLTCAVVARADQNEHSHEFGRNLGAAFGVSDLFINRSALPKLWVRLQQWCNKQRKNGLPFREVSLPLPGVGKHLGLTNAITFPSWRDLAHLRVVLERNAKLAAVRDPVDAAKRFCPIVRHDDGFTDAMRLAGAEYQRLYDAQASLLRLHRFWRAISGLLGGRRPAKRRPTRVPRLELRFGADLDDTELRLSVVCSDGVELAQERELVEGPPDEVMRDLENWLNSADLTKEAVPAIAVLTCEAVPFLEENFGVWVADHTAPDPPRRCALLLSKERQDRIPLGPTTTTPVGENWLLVGPYPAVAVPSLYERLGLPSAGSSRDTTQWMRLHGGLRAGSAGEFLGRVFLLPQVSVFDQGSLSLRRSVPNQPSATLTKDTNGDWRIKADEPLIGRYVLRLEEALVVDVDPLALERSVDFFPDAHEHADLSQPSSTRWTPTVEAIVETTREPKADLTFIIRKSIERKEEPRTDAAARFDDLLEAIYAQGRSGLSEQVLIETIHSVLSTKAPSPWDILRALHECDWLMPMSCSTWRARRWWLKPPTLIAGKLGHEEATILRGSAPLVIRRRFGQTVTAMGGRVEVSRGAGDYCPDTLLSVGVRPETLATELRWALSVPPVTLTTTAPACWFPEACDPSKHDLAGTWDWRAGRFFPANPMKEGAVALERYRRERGDRPDIFSVSGGVNRAPLTTTSRVVAIAEAYRRAEAPLFERMGDFLIRLTNDGYLPLALAREAVTRMACCAGPASVEGRWRYAYAADSRIVAAAQRVLGIPFIRDTTHMFDPEGRRVRSDTIARWRHRGTFRLGVARDVKRM